MIPALLALLPALALSAWTRVYFAPAPVTAQAPQDAPSALVLEVLIAEGGYRLRVSDPADGWQAPLRTARRTRLAAGETFVARGPGLPPDALLTAARGLLDGVEAPRVQLRAEDAMPWAAVLEAGAVLEPILGRDVAADSLLAGMLVDARP